ncbi:putative cobalamin reductase PduS [Clostridium neonatale]|uniref:SLBB domain-containing protein n=1 Tax=Clostridium neonatale TaxID=137838 RepID=UPI001D906332|nr:SLBB domain-containing protein [Clostridium neonatale]CAG9712323.1 Putative cobalamin reductase PduS [Clostridium neonatale]CAI3654004.1 putative cobalamin reductase PduS [Clostridium neonatale]
MDILELKEIMQNNGIVGAGGAGFPSYAKLNDGIDIIILNCAECEPLLKLHQQLLALKASDIVNALNLIAEIVGAKEVVIATKECYAKTVEAAQEVIEARKFYAKTRISFLPEIYPAGDEIITIYESTGRIVEPGKLPLSVGVIVYNVETVYNIYQALFENKPVTHKYITIAGEVNEPKTIKVPIGITFDEVVNLAGGSTIENPAYVHGGPMTGKLAKGIDVITKTSNGILVLPQDQYIVRKKNQNIAISVKQAKSVCCQCNRCTEMCPRNMIGYPIEPHAVMKNLMFVNKADVKSSLNTFFCSQCGICEMYACEQSLSPQTLISECKTQLRNNGIAAPKDIKLSKMNELRKARMISVERLTARLGLSKYDRAAPLSIEEISTKQVKIKLSQHIGVPSIPVVKKGAFVEEGQLIAKVKENSLSVPCHSSMAGIVLDVNEKYIIIGRR